MTSRSTKHQMSRRGFLGRLAAAGLGAGAALASGRLGPGPALIERPGGFASGAPAAPPPAPGAPPDKLNEGGVTVKPDDPSITAGPVEFPGLVGPILGYLAEPAGGQVYPGVLILHDADGLTEHARDVARRFAKVGYSALVPDMLSRFGGTAKVGDTTKVLEAFGKLPGSQIAQDLVASIRYLGARPQVAKSQIGVLAWGYGGVLAWPLLAQNADLKAAVLYHAVPLPNAIIPPLIKAAVLAVYAERDGHDADDLKDLDAEMKKHSAPWSFKIEPKAGRGFFDDSRRSYVPEAAKDAWKLTLDWLRQHLAG